MVFLRNAGEQRLNTVCIFPVDSAWGRAQRVTSLLLHSAFITATFRVMRAESGPYHLSFISWSGFFTCPTLQSKCQGPDISTYSTVHWNHKNFSGPGLDQPWDFVQNLWQDCDTEWRSDSFLYQCHERQMPLSAASVSGYNPTAAFRRVIVPLFWNKQEEK